MINRSLILVLTGLCLAFLGLTQEGLAQDSAQGSAARQDVPPGDSLAVSQSDRSLGILAGGIPSDGRLRPASGNYLLGIYARHLYPGDFFGEIRASVGVVENGEGTARLIPLEYRLNFRLLPVLTSEPGGQKGISPFVYMGSGLLYHRVVASVPARDPRTGNLNGRLPASSLYSLGNGLTPFFSLGAGFDVALDPSLTLHVHVGSTRPFHQIALSGRGYRSNYLDLSLGINVRIPSRRRVASPGTPPAVPPPPREPAKQQQDTAAVQQAEADTLAGKPVPEPSTYFAVADCRFAVQAGGYLSYRNALDVVDSLTAVSGEYPVIHYDSKRKLYVVRSASSGSPSEVLSLMQRLQGREIFRGAALYQGCGLQATPPTLQFQVQVGAFSDSLNARNRALELEEKFEVSLQVERAEESSLYRVRSAPYPSLGRGKEALGEFKAMGMGDTLFLARGRPGRDYAPQYSFLLQVRRYGDLEEARRGLGEWEQKTGRSLEIWHYRGEGGFYALGLRSGDWSAMQAVREELESQFPELDSVLYLNETME